VLRNRDEKGKRENRSRKDEVTKYAEWRGGGLFRQNKYVN
jgi:hypothetical protein